MSVEEVKNNAENKENQLQETYIKSYAQVEEGQMLPGEVIEVGSEYVYVDVGLKSEGKIKLSEFEEAPKMGDTVYVILLKKESRHGEVIVSKQKADEKMFWKNLRQAFDQHEPVEGKIVKKIKGGFEVDLGNDNFAFLPLSKTDTMRVNNPDEYIDLESHFYIERLYHRGKANIVVTRKDWLENEIKERKQQFFEEARIGDEVTGKVKSFTSFGAFIDPRAAITLGMIPDLPLERYQALGNSSLEGASMMLTGRGDLAKVDRIRDRITYLELNVNQAFMNRFSAAKFIPHTNRDLFPSVT